MSIQEQIDKLQASIIEKQAQLDALKELVAKPKKWEPLPGMTIADHARIQFIAAALTGWSGSDRHAQWSVGEIAAEAIFYADAALKAGGYIE